MGLHKLGARSTFLRPIPKRFHWPAPSMRKPGRLAVVAVSLPFLAGCFTVARAPVPATLPEREALDLKGVVITQPDNGTEEVLEFSQLHEAVWTPSSLSVVGDVAGSGPSPQTVTRLIPITNLDAVLVRQIDGGKTSAIIGGVVMGAIATIALLVTGSDPRVGG